MKNPTLTNNWQILKKEYERFKSIHLYDLFNQDINRFDKFSIRFTDITFDYSKNKIDENVISYLIQLCNEVNLKDGIEKMFNGQKINFTENRAVLHTALRKIEDEPIIESNINIIPLIKKVLKKMEDFTYKIRNGNWTGYTGKQIKNVVNIGIGGSHLGPAMVCEALKSYSDNNINIFFVSNVDGCDLTETLKNLNPENTLFIIASKTFTTLETMANAYSAKDWFLSNTDADDNDIAKHFVALSTNKKACYNFGIPEENMFEFWDWVGGRFSLWSSIGLSIALFIGFDNFKKLLYGAYLADNHFRFTPFERNIPVIMALLTIWYVNFFGYMSYAIVPYNQYLKYLPDFLQQLIMESNGKYVDSNGNEVTYLTSPVIWGSIGTNSQHSYFQLLHQGTQTIPVDFIVSMIPNNSNFEHQDKLVANCFAQSEALMKGKTKEEVVKELQRSGIHLDEFSHLIPHKVFKGNIPSNTFLIKKITPETLGSLIAFYEHKVFVEGYIWNINSFDQWGVELGKQLATNILNDFKSETKISYHDSSTNSLINLYKKYRKNN